MNRIETLIKKAECIKEYLKENNKKKGNIDQLIASLKSYQEKHEDLPPDKHFYIIVNYMNFDNIRKKLPVCINGDWTPGSDAITGKYAIMFKSSEFTDHIRDILLDNIYVGIWSMPPSVIGYDIADAVWDIESTKVNDIKLTNKLIAAGLKPTSNNIKFVRDFD